MSFDQSFMNELVEAVAEAGLQVVFIGNAAAVLHGVPVLTQDVDLMVREHPQLSKKLTRFAEIFGVKLTEPYQPVSKVIRAVGRSVGIDFVFSLSSQKSFESVRSRATRLRIGNRRVWVASLEEIVDAKEAADGPQDKATLQVF